MNIKESIENKKYEELDHNILKEIHKHSVEFNNQKDYTNKEKKIVINDFKTYLSSLNNYLDDNTFYEKSSKLPKIQSHLVKKAENSSTIKKFDSEENNEQNSVNFLKEEKHEQARFIVYEFNSNKSFKDNHKQEDNKDIRLNMHNPIKVYMHDDNQKMRKFALDQILAKVTTVDEKRIEKLKKIDVDAQNKIEGYDKFIHTLDDITKNSQFKKMDQNEQSKHLEFMKVFNTLCENNRIITNDQKIDYYIYLRNSNIFNINSFNIKDGSRRQNKKSSTMNNSKKSSEEKKLINNFKKDSLKSKNIARNSSILKPKDSIIKNVNNLKENIKHISIENESSRFFKYLKDCFGTKKSNLQNNDNNSNDKVKDEFLVSEKEINDVKFRLLNIDLTADLEKMTYSEKLKYINNYSELSNTIFVFKDFNINLQAIYSLHSKNYFTFSTLQYLSVSRNNLHDIELSIIVKLLEDFSHDLKHLNISHNKVNLKTSLNIQSLISKPNCKIKSINLSHNYMGDENFTKISVGISKNTSITKIWLCNNNLGKVSVVILGTILRYDKKLTLLDLSNNNINDDTVVYLFKGIISNNALKYLYLNSLGLTSKSIDNLETSLYINSSLKELYLDNNLIGNKATTILYKILNKNKIIDLISLLGNNINNDGIDNITDNYKHHKKITFINKIDCNIRKIASLNNNKFDLLQHFYEDYY